MTITNKELAQWFDTTSTLIKILEEYNDNNPQINFASEAARLQLVEFLIEKIKARDKEEPKEEPKEETEEEK